MRCTEAMTWTTSYLLIFHLPDKGLLALPVSVYDSHSRLCSRESPSRHILRLSTPVTPIDQYATSLTLGILPGVDIVDIVSGHREAASYEVQQSSMGEHTQVTARLPGDLASTSAPLDRRMRIPIIMLILLFESGNLDAVRRHSHVVWCI